MVNSLWSRILELNSTELFWVIVTLGVSAVVLVIIILTIIKQFKKRWIKKH